ncbi:c-type cytochrome [Vitreoscilla massiliensis]|uniref:C-type cytochrome n=1 Tax=Vitreoscilla massiliensis TaxID=1689272 RepID=A0ABY4DXV3_9NEIS|nr:c-type cytochrome [Vitreoscilla massiliensis]UOO87784.1 c-type cytochrome [Vitreoscilla massiliensis]
MKHPLFALVRGILPVCLALAACSETPTAATPQQFAVKVAKEVVKSDYQVPSVADVKGHSNEELIRYGGRLLNETKRLLPNNVGASMNCNSCHIANGKEQKGAPYVNANLTYPQKMPRAGKMVDLAMRINGCFQRSMNGKPLDVNSKEMQAMLAYMAWLSEGLPKKAKIDFDAGGKIDESLVPNPERGKLLYAQQCVSCHGDNGQGSKDARGNVVFPPLWGEESFNIGAGMARTYKAAAFLRDNMPMSVQKNGAWGQGGVLSDQDAVDIAEYFTHQPRPDFAGKVKDWPEGNKPKDARY